MIDAGVAVGGVEEHVRKPLLRQRTITKRGDLGVQISADPRDLALGDPAISAKDFDQIVDLAGRRAMQIGLHHHREQALSTRRRRSNNAERTTRTATWGYAAPDHRPPWTASEAANRCDDWCGTR
jgi:hypothetical protein